MGKIKRRRSKSKDGDYNVGYGKPPQQNQFSKGQSGNWAGRPKGSRNFKSDVNTTLNAPVKVTRDGKPQKVTTQKAMLLRLREKALGGDSRSLDQFIELAQAYSDQESFVSVELSDEDENVLNVYRRRILSGAISDPQTETEFANRKDKKNK